MERLVGLLDLLDPHVKRVEFLFNQVIEVVRGIEDGVDGSHQEGEESQSHELQGNRENVLLRGASRVISISDGSDDFKDPVEGKDVLSVISLVPEVIGKGPRLCAIFFGVFWI